MSDNEEILFHIPEGVRLDVAGWVLSAVAEVAEEAGFGAQVRNRPGVAFEAFVPPDQVPALDRAMATYGGDTP